MLAALIAQHNVQPRRKLFYSGQFIAATNTFRCIEIARRAAQITTSLPIQIDLALSLPGKESIFDNLNRTYFRIISEYSTDGTQILNDNIIAAIITATVLTGVLATLPVSMQNAMLLTILQKRLAIALANLINLGKFVN